MSGSLRGTITRLIPDDLSRKGDGSFRGFSMRLRLAALAFALTTLALPAAANAPRTPAHSTDRVFPYDAQLPNCGDPSVFTKIANRFNAREKRDWNSSLEIKGLDRARETHFRPNGADLIPRRYCTARALLSDGKYRTVTYYMTEDQGITGWHGSLFSGLLRFATPSSYGIEWCVSGLDRHRVHAQDCRMARP
jgi:hypothetical protein